MKYAWLIIAHNEFEVLQQLVSLLDVPESGFYIHFDKKVKVLPKINVENGRIVILKDRVDVCWGSVSQIKTELALLESAIQDAPYDYYHILSGTTLPLKSLDEINQFFLSMKGKSVVTGMTRDSIYQETLKLRRYNLFLRNYMSQNKHIRRTDQFLWRSFIAFQRVLGITTNSAKTFYKASNWLSLTEEAGRMILSRKKEILKTYRWSFCGDEFFIPSELMDSPLREKIYNDDKYLLHTIGRANARTYHFSEWSELRKTEYLFARKFTQ